MPFIPSSPTRLYTFRRRSLRPQNGGQEPDEVGNEMGKLRKAQIRSFKPESGDAPADGAVPIDVIAAEPSPSALTKAADVQSVVPNSTDAGAASEAKQKPTSPAKSKPLYTFFDNNSDSEYSVEEDGEPIVGHASSVRVSKPIIVQNKNTKSQNLKSKDSDRIAEPERRSALKHTLLSSTTEEDEHKSSRKLSHTGQIETGDPKHSPPRKHSNDDQDTDQALPTGNTLHSIYPTIVEPNTTDIGEDAPTQGVNRTMSSPLPLPGKGLSRRVTIRPSDLIIKGNKERTSFRESVVTTPYPKRHDSDASSMNFDTSKDTSTESISPDRPISPTDKGKGKAKRPIPSTTNATMHSTGEKDRFPSPERSETLFLDLSLSRHPLARTTLEIQIANKSTFDDEALFTQIRAAYNKQLLGTRRWPFTLIRRIGYVRVPSDTRDFNNIDFIKHLHAPRLGRKRKAWVIWLRNNNSRTPARATALVPPTAAHIKQLEDLNQLSTRPRKLSLSNAFSGRRSSRGNNRSHHTEKNPVAGVDDHPVNKRFSVASSASTAGSFNFVYSPAIPRLPFLSAPKSGDAPSANNNAISPVRSFFWPNNLSSALSASTSPSPHPSEGAGTKIVTVSFQHEFRVGAVALLTGLVVLQAAVAALVWVVFGVPGSRPGQEVGMTDWKIDAKGRVLTGIIIGLVVFLVGCLGEGALVWGSWLLL